MTELFTRHIDNYFKQSIGINSLLGHFIKMEKELRVMMGLTESTHDAVQTDMFEAEKMLSGDQLFRALVVQRSRAYVRESQKMQGGSLSIFPETLSPLRDFLPPFLFFNAGAVVAACFQIPQLPF